MLVTVSEDRVRFLASMLGGSKVPVTPPLRELKVSGLRGELLCTIPYMNNTDKHIESKNKSEIKRGKKNRNRNRMETT